MSRQDTTKHPAHVTRRRPVVMALEPRFMFDGAAAVTHAHAALDAAHLAQIPVAPAPVEVQAANPALDHGKTEAVFVDTSVPDWSALVAGVEKSNPGVEIELIDGGQSGLAQIATWAETHSGYDAIHILSEGSEATLAIGTDTITDASLATAATQAELAEIGSALKAGGELALYGSNIGAGADGQQFLTDLAADTGAVVAGSGHEVGAASLSGDWTLDTTTGTPTVTPLAIPGYLGTLDIGEQVTDTAPAAVEVQAADPSQDGGKTEVVFIDSAVVGFQTLVADVAPGIGIELIDGSQSGLSQMASWAATHSGYNSISVLSHGSEGSVTVGSSVVADTTLSSPTAHAEFAEIGSALTPGGDLLLYGCDVAKGEDGQQFINDVANDTGAVVEAATHTVGASSLGGSWTLDARAGGTAIPATPFNGANWDGALDYWTWTAVSASDCSDYIVSNTITVGSDGTIYAAYQNSGQDSTTYDYGVVKFTGGAWVPVGGAISCNGSYGGPQIPPALQFGSTGTLYIAYQNVDGNVMVEKFNGTAWVAVGGITDATGVSADSNGQAFSMAMGPNGTVYVAFIDPTYAGSGSAVPTPEIREFSNGAWTSSFAPANLTGGCADVAIAVNQSSGALWVASTDTSGNLQVQEYTTAAGWTLPGQTAGTPINTYGEWSKLSMQVGPDGTPYVLAFSNGGHSPAVTAYTSGSWQVLGAIDPSASDYTGCIAVSSTNTLAFVGSAEAQTWNPANGGSWQTIGNLGAYYANTESLYNESAAFAPNGTLYVSGISTDGGQWAGAKVYGGAAPPANVTLTNLAGSEITNSQIFGTAVMDGLGNLYVYDYNNQVVDKFSNGTYSTFGGNSIFTSMAVTLAVDGSNDIFAYDGNSGRVYEMAAGASTFTLVVNNQQLLAGQAYCGIASDAAGDLYIASDKSNDIYEFSVGSYNAPVVISTQSVLNTFLSQLLINASDTTLYEVSSNGSTSVQGSGGNTCYVEEINISTGAVSIVPGIGSTYGLRSVAIDASGNLFFSGWDTNTNGAIFELTSNGGFGEIYQGGLAGSNSMMSMPFGLAVSSAGYLYAIDDSSNYILTDGPASPSITSAAYSAVTGVLTIDGTSLTTANGDYSPGDLTLKGQGGNTVTLSASDVVSGASASSVTLTLSAADKLEINGLLNANGVTAADGTTAYALAATSGWDSSIAAAITGEAITVSNVTAPTISTVAYNESTGVLTVTGSHLVELGTSAGIVPSDFTIAGTGGSVALTTAASAVSNMSASGFTLQLNGADEAAVAAKLDQNGTSSTTAVTYKLTASADWDTDSAAAIASGANQGITVSGVVPTLVSATYNESTGLLTVTGRNVSDGTVINPDKLQITGLSGGTYTLAGSYGSITSTGDVFSLTLTAADQAGVDAKLTANGTSDGTTYSIDAATNWMPSTAAVTGTHGITVSGVPTITSAAYNAGTGVLTIDGTTLTTSNGDYSPGDLTLKGQGGNTVTLSAGDAVSGASATAVTLTLSAADALEVNGLLNANGVTAADGTTAYALAATSGWDSGIGAATTGAVITVSNVTAPTISTVAYNQSTGVLTVTGSHLVELGTSAGIVPSDFTIAGTGGSVALTTAASAASNMSASGFTLQLNGADEAAVAAKLDQNGTSSTTAVTYKLTASADWDTDSAAAIASGANQGITVSGVVPTLVSAIYNESTGLLTVTGRNVSDGTVINPDKLQITGLSGGTYTLAGSYGSITSTGDVFSLTLTAADQAGVDAKLTANGTSDGTTYSIDAATNWMPSTAAVTGTHGITVSGVPTITSAAYNAGTGVLTIDGTSLTTSNGDYSPGDLTLIGQGGNTMTLSASDVVSGASATAVTLTLSAADKLEINGLLNANGVTAADGTTAYALAATSGWDSSIGAAITGEAITVSNVTAPTISTVAYNESTGVLTVTGSHLVELGTSAGIVPSDFTIAGTGGSVALTTAASAVSNMSASGFTLQLNGADEAAVAAKLDQNGTSSTTAVTYKLTAAADWDTDSAAAIASGANQGITVSDVAPSVSATHTSSAQSYVLAGNAAVIDGGIVASSGAGWNGGNLDVTVTGGRDGTNDVLSIVQNATITVSGTSVSYASTVFGTISGAPHNGTAGTDLKITFNSNATNAMVQALADAIGFADATGTSAAQRTVTFAVTDSVATTSVADLVAVSDTTPVFAGGSTSLTVVHGGSVNLAADLLVSDTDSNQTETWSQAVAPSQGGTLTFTNATAASGSASITPGGTITYAPAAGFVGTETFSVQVSDGRGGIATRSFTVTVEGPSASGGTANQIFAETNNSGTPLSGVTVADNAGEGVTVTVTVDGTTLGNLGTTTGWTAGTSGANATYTETFASAAAANTALHALTWTPVQGAGPVGGTSVATEIDVRVANGTASATDTADTVKVTYSAIAPSNPSGGNASVISAAGAAVTIDGALAFSDPNYNTSTGTAVGNWGGGSLDVAIAANGDTAHDTLAIAQIGGITTSGSGAGATVSYNGTVIGTIASGDVGAPGEHLTITLLPAATNSAVTALAEAIRFSSPGSASTAARAVTFTARDGTGANVTATDTVSVDNGPTVIAGTTAAYTERAAATVLNSGLALSDSLSSTMTGATVTISSGLTIGDTLAATTAGTNITASYANGVLTLTGADTLAHYQAALDSVSFANAGAADSTSASPTRTITWRATDTYATGAAATSTLTLIPVNQAPTLTATTTAATTDLVAVATAPLFGGAQISPTVAGEAINQIKLTVSGLADGAAETLRIDGSNVALSNGASGTSTGGYAIAYAVTVSGTTATVTLSKSGGMTATVADAVVNGLAYLDTSATATAGTRTITLTSVQNTGGTAHGGIDTTAVALASTATVVVSDTPVLSAATTNPSELGLLTPMAIPGISVGNSQDGIYTATVTATGGMVILGGTTGASVSVSGTLAQVNAALAGLQYTPNGFGTGQIAVVVSDGGTAQFGGAKSAGITATATATALPPPPPPPAPAAPPVATIAASAPPESASPAAPVITVSNLSGAAAGDNFASPVTPTAATVAVVAQPIAAPPAAAAQAPTPADTAVAAPAALATAPAPAAAPATAAASSAPGSTTTTVATPPPAQATVAAAASAAPAAPPFAPTTASLVPLTATLSAPSDGGFQVAVAANSAGPGITDVMVAKPIGIVEAVGKISFSVPSDAFAVGKADSTVTLSATRADGTPLPPWMVFNAAKGSFEGTPPPGEKAIEVTVTARDQSGHDASQKVKIEISDKHSDAGQPRHVRTAFVGRAGLTAQFAAARHGHSAHMALLAKALGKVA